MKVRPNPFPNRMKENIIADWNVASHPWHSIFIHLKSALRALICIYYLHYALHTIKYNIIMIKECLGNHCQVLNF